MYTSQESYTTGTPTFRIEGKQSQHKVLRRGVCQVTAERDGVKCSNLGAGENEEEAEQALKAKDVEIVKLTKELQREKERYKHVCMALRNALMLGYIPQQQYYRACVGICFDVTTSPSQKIVTCS